MPKNVYNNIEGHRVIDGERVAEDVTSVTLPTITHPTSTIAAAGMAGDVDMPNMVHVDAMEISIAHNNGTNCNYLSSPGKHMLEFRLVRQKFNTASGDLGHESVKYRITGIHKETEKGSIEINNPLGSTEKYSVLRYEEEIAGEVVTLIDIMAGIIKINGVNYTDVVESMLA